MREVAVPVATVWTSPDAPRPLDADALADAPDVAGWAASLDTASRLDLHGRTLTQLLMGEPALVLEEVDGWSHVEAPHQRSSAHQQGYPGWVRTAHLGAPVDRMSGPTAFVTAPSARCDVEGGTPQDLSCGTGLWVEPGPDAAVRVLLPGGRRGTVARSDVRLTNKDEAPAYSPDDLLATARQLLGVGYLWGGLSGWGLDCSGLVHLTFRAHGERLPRDAADQSGARVLEPVGLDEVQPGDLYLFARPVERVYHVGFVTRPVEADGTRWMLHAPEGGGIEEAPIAAERLELLVSAGRVRPWTERE